MASNAEEKNPEDQFTFNQQLSYCQLVLEKKLEKERLSPKAAQCLLRALKILTSEKASFIKKRQVMRVSCGDYRKDMLNMVQSTNKCMDELINNGNEVEKVDTGLCHQFSRKRAHNQTDETEAQVPPFRFNFPLPENDSH